MLVQFNSEESRSNYRSLWNQFLNKVLNIGVLNTVSKTITGAINELLSKFNILTGLTSTVTAAATTTLTVDSNNTQQFTGSTTQTIQMPVVSTLVLGRTFKIINNSTGILIVNSSGSDLITTIEAGVTKILTCVKITGTDKTSWTVNKNISEIYIPAIEPIIVTGTPNTLTFDMNLAQQAMFEPRLSSGTRSINVDFDFIISNDSNARLLSAVISLTGIRTIIFESDVICKNASQTGIWTDGSKQLELTCGTNDIREFQFIRDITGSQWLLKVGEADL